MGCGTPAKAENEKNTDAAKLNVGSQARAFTIASWTAAVFCRFENPGVRTESGRGLPHSKTWRHSDEVTARMTCCHSPGRAPVAVATPVRKSWVTIAVFMF